MALGDMRVCKCCHKEFIVSREHLKFCSSECANVFGSHKQICPICGTIFSIIRSWNPLRYYKRKVYCSKGCAKKAAIQRNTKKKKEKYNSDSDYREKIKAKQRAWNKTDAGKVVAQRNKLSRDKRIKNMEAVDKDIDLHALYDRDDGICWICGQVCDWNDCELKTSFSGRNYLATYSKYPSIDHVIPLSKDGTHTWDNVRLAHKGCNISKGNNILCVVAEKSANA